MLAGCRPAWMLEPIPIGYPKADPNPGPTRDPDGHLHPSSCHIMPSVIGAVTTALLALLINGRDNTPTNI
jgi:hypothetical protein